MRCPLVAWMLAALMLATAPCLAAPEVTIGAIYPQAADRSRAAVATAVAVVNEKHAPILLLMGAGGGLNRLDNATLRAADGTADDPAQAEAEAERLVTAERVVALVGGGPPLVSAAIRRVATRHAIPYLALDLGPPAGDGLTWGFALAPTDATVSAALFQFLRDQGPAIGRDIKTLGLVYEDTPAVVALSDVQRRLADDAGLKRVVQLNLRPDAPGLATEVETIVEQKPDAVIATLGAGNAIRLVRDLADRRALPLWLGQGSGCADPAFATGLSPAADGVFCTTGFVPDAVVARPGLPALGAAFQARTGSALDAEAAGVMTTVLLIADVIDRAGSTKPLDLRIALMATDAPGDKLPMAWRGIRFDDSGQNVLAEPAIGQVQGGAYRVVAPDEVATAKPAWPVK